MNWWQLLLRWWMSDRIRVAPDLNRHLRLQPGQRVIIDERLMVVVCRVEGQIERMPSVRYQLERLHERNVPPRLVDANRSSPRTQEPPWVWDPVAAGDVIVIHEGRDRCWIECVYFDNADSL